MKPIDVIIESRHKSAEKLQDQNNLVTSFGNATKDSTQSIAMIMTLLNTLQLTNQTDTFKKLEQFLNENRKDTITVSNLGEIVEAIEANRSEFKFPETFSLPDLEIKPLTIEGFQEIIDQLKTLLAQIKLLIDAFKTIDFSLPEIKIPNIIIPESSINVMIPPSPPVTIPTPEVTIVQEEKSIKRIISETYTQNAKGQLCTILEIYEDGTTHKVRGLETGHIIHEYR